MTDRTEVETTLRKFLEESLMQGHSFDFGPDDNLREAVGLDSLGAVEFVDAIEEEFEIDISDDEFRSISTFKDAVDLAMIKLEENPEIASGTKD